MQYYPIRSDEERAYNMIIVRKKNKFYKENHTMNAIRKCCLVLRSKRKGETESKRIEIEVIFYSPSKRFKYFSLMASVDIKNLIVAFISSFIFPRTLLVLNDYFLREKFK